MDAERPSTLPRRFAPRRAVVLDWHRHDIRGRHGGDVIAGAGSRLLRPQILDLTKAIPLTRAPRPAA
jgi:hypothetical protein